MPNTLLYECFSGIAGDLHMAAMLDLGMPADHLKQELAKLGLGSEFRLEISTSSKMGISGTRVDVEVLNKSQHARNLTQIRSLIESSALSPYVKQKSTAIFQSLGEAEAKVHGVDIDQVHFHEVGAIDAIVDITAAAIALNYFNPDEVYCNAVELGSGMVKCAHGLMPVPAPATALLLNEKPTTRGNVTGEATTPTGAAILSHAVTHWSNPNEFTSTKTAHGIGHKDFERPNVFRVTLGESQSIERSETNTVIECNIDDMSPEAYDPLIEQLFQLGASDVFLTPIVMKKSRPGIKLSVLATHELQHSIVDCILEQSTTIGLRSYDVSKFMLPRDQLKVDTPLGEVGVKLVTLPSGNKRWKVEHDDVKAASEKYSTTYLEAKRQINEHVAKKLNS